MILGIGFVPVILTTTGLIVGTAPPEPAGSASALSETSAEFGGALGVALLGSLGTVIYRMMMSGVDLTGLSPQQVEAASATLASAVEAAKALGPDAPAWLDPARSAFSLGFAVCCAVAAVTLLLLAVIAKRIYARAHLDESALTAH